MGGFFATTDEKRDEWEEHLTRPHFVSMQYLQMKNGGLGPTPLDSYRDLMMPTLHPSHKDYSEIETTKRGAIKIVERKRNRQPEPTNCFVYPCNHWKAFIPKAYVFKRFPKFKNPYF